MLTKKTCSDVRGFSGKAAFRKEVQTMNAHQDVMKHPWTSHEAFVNALAPAGFALSALGAIVAVLSGFGNRWDWWYYTTAFTILRWAAVCAIVGVVVSLLAGIIARPGLRKSGFYLALAGIVLGLVVAGIPWSWLRAARQTPPIHDITTDFQNPPQFVSILPLRKGAEDSAVYGGPAVAAMQKEAYPGIKPLILPLPAHRSFDLALEADRRMGWKIVGVSPAHGRIEATATTFWFGFKDDVVVRVSPLPDGSRLDVRSVSRVGRSDLGVNAKRIQAYLRTLANMTGEEKGSPGAP